MKKICGVHFFCVIPEKSFLEKSGQKNQNIWYKESNLNMRNSMMMFTFPLFDHKYLSWANLVQKFKIVCSK